MDLKEPLDLFSDWWKAAQQLPSKTPDAVALATVDAAHRPAVRFVLLKHFDERGFVFFTNYESRKGQQLEANPQAALCFYWESMERQIRVEGEVERTTTAESDAYFVSRPRDSQLGAWASDQSRKMSGPAELKIRVAKAVAKFPVGSVPRPESWGGYRIIPRRFEFWQGKAFRLHDRYEYQKQSDNRWEKSWLFP